MKRFAWLTDIHLNFVERDAVEEFIRTVAETDCDGILLSGDIGEAPDAMRYLNDLDTAVQKPIYFVLGNHDFYRGSIAWVRQDAETICEACPNLHWLPISGVVSLTEKTCLVGADGWGDGRYGDYWGLKVHLNDWELIDEFKRLDDKSRLAKLQQLGDEAAEHFRAILPDALEGFEHVVVVTHVPPFRESCWHEGRISDDDWLPHFACKPVGEVLADTMKRWPGRQMTVLCGHTHGAGEARILPNLKVFTGGAEYGNPIVQRVLEVE
jgi:predicted phosphohydrolase